MFALFVLLITFQFLPDKLIFGSFFLLATLFVDVDSKKSKLGKFFLFRPLQLFFSHRGIFHSLFFGFILSIALFFFNLFAAYGFLAGYLLHLILDCLTLQGVYLFKPFSSRKIKGFLKSGGIVEEILFVLLLLTNIFLVGKRLFEMLS
jgi:inner membrane protein